MSNTMIHDTTWDNRSALGGAGNTTRGLTRSSDYGREGLAMKATRVETFKAPRTPLVIPPEVAHRALSGWTFEAPTGCHISTYSTGSHGYAQIGWERGGERRMTLCHRAAWVGVYGPIPEGMTIDHTCKNRRCVNIEHLRMLTNYENARRTSGRDWPLGQCINGHPNSDATQSGAKRVCGKCRSEWQRKYREAKL